MFLGRYASHAPNGVLKPRLHLPSICMGEASATWIRAHWLSWWLMLINCLACSDLKAWSKIHSLDFVRIIPCSGCLRLIMCLGLLYFWNTLCWLHQMTELNQMINMPACMPKILINVECGYLFYLKFVYWWYICVLQLLMVLLLWPRRNFLLSWLMKNLWVTLKFIITGLRICSSIFLLLALLYWFMVGTSGDVVFRGTGL